uniref:HEPN domain-containing protein n=1 Tax=viral metagenome TaxID=1070528 RepID=A0A6C0EQB5_9ZZZZ
MNRVFYGTFISHAKNELKNLDYLLIRATNGFLPEKSIDEAIYYLKKTQEHLTQAKKELQTSNTVKVCQNSLQP